MTYRSFALVLFLVALAAHAFAESAVIPNPAEPPVIETWRLREVWHLDNEENEGLPLMGIVNQAVVTDDGHLFFLDHQMAHVLEISPQGEYLRTLGRSGQGPGELERPNTIYLADDGRLGLVQVFPGKVVLLNRDGTPDGGFRSTDGSNPMFFQVREAAGVRIVGGSSSEFSEAVRTNRPFLRRETEEGASHVFLASEETTRMDPPVMKEAGSWFPHGAWDQMPDGSVLVAPERDAYRIDWFEPDGGLRARISREFQPHRRTASERRKVEDRMRMWGPSGEMEVRKTILDTEPAIHALQILDDGSIWVRSCYAERDLPDGVFIRYDVFDAGGRLQKEVRIEHSANREKDLFRLLNDGRFVWYRNGISVVDSYFAAIEGGNETEEDEEQEDVGLQVILLERSD